MPTVSTEAALAAEAATRAPTWATGTADRGPEVHLHNTSPSRRRGRGSGRRASRTRDLRAQSPAISWRPAARGSRRLCLSTRRSPTADMYFMRRRAVGAGLPVCVAPRPSNGPQPAQVVLRERVGRVFLRREMHVITTALRDACAQKAAAPPARTLDWCDVLRDVTSRPALPTLAMPIGQSQSVSSPTP